MVTLEIDGKAVAVTNADEEQARELFLSESFKDDLKSFKSESRSLWDGSAALTTRPASEDEIDAFYEALDEEDEVDEATKTMTTTSISMSCSWCPSTK